MTNRDEGPRVRGISESVLVIDQPIFGVMDRRSFLTFLFGITVFLLMLLPKASEAALTDDLIGYWPLDGDATDASGAGVDGVWTGTAAYGTGMLGQGVSLDGTNFVGSSSPLHDRFS